MKRFYKIFPLVSVVITTKNEKAHILNCIKSVRAQTYLNIELLVIDNYSTDGTIEIAKEYADRLFLVGPERSAQRNRGMGDEAKGEFVIFLDADMRLQPNLIEEAVKQIQETKSDALYISEIVMGDSFLSKIRRYERSYYDSTVVDCVRFIKRDAFIKVGGFDLSLTGPEDWDLDKKLKQKGYKFSLLKNSWINHNESNINLKDYLNKKSYYATSFNKYKEKWGADDPDIKKQLGFYYRFIKVFTENQKYKKILNHPILFIGLIYLRFRVGLRYLRRNK